MPYYQFVARTEDSQVEKLGVMDLRHDGDALSFADAIIRDLSTSNRGSSALTEISANPNKRRQGRPSTSASGN